MIDNKDKLPENKDEHLQEKRFHDNSEFVDHSDLFDTLKRKGTLWKIEETDLKADSIVPVAKWRRNARFPTERIEVAEEQWSLEGLIAAMHSQLDSIWIRDEEDGDMKRKYRERVRSDVRKLPENGIVPFCINASDMTGRVKEEFFNLEDGQANYVMPEIIDRIFDSIGESYLKLKVRDLVDWEISET